MATEKAVMTASGQVWTMARVIERLSGLRAVDQAFRERALILLAGHCDGARTRDGVGYNGRDTNFCKDLADQLQGLGSWQDASGTYHPRRGPRPLTEKQDAAARRILPKYAGQILERIGEQPGATVNPIPQIAAYGATSPRAAAQAVAEVALTFVAEPVPETVDEAWAAVCSGPSAAERAAELQAGEKGRVDRALAHHAVLTRHTVKGGTIKMG